MAHDDQQSIHLETTCTLQQADFDRFADISGDHNPIHVDAAYAQDTVFGATVSHGMLLFSHVRALMARACPGMRLIQQELMFPAPSYADEILTLVVDGVRDGQGRVQFVTQVHKPDGRLGLDGHATLVPEEMGEMVPVLAAQSVVDAGHVPGVHLPRFSALRVGDRAQVRRCFSVANIQAWAEMAHMPERPNNIPEPLIAALYSYLLGEQLPGHGTNYLKQSLRFHGLAEVNERLQAEVQVTGLRADKALVNLDTRCHGADGRLLCSGRALVLFRC